MGAGAERHRRQDFRPDGLLDRIVFHRAGHDPAGGRIVAREEGGIDVEALDPTGNRKFDDREIMAEHALAAGLPTIHPLAVIIIFVGDENRRLVLQHPLERRKELVRGVEPLCPEAGGSQVDALADEVGSGKFGGIGHG